MISSILFSFDFIVEDGSGIKGRLQARVRRAAWHYRHTGQTMVNGKYPLWSPTIVNVDLTAKDPEWKAAVLAKDASLWREIQEFVAASTDLGVVGGFLKKKPSLASDVQSWVEDGEQLLLVLKRDVARLERNLQVAKEDLADRSSAHPASQGSQG